MQITLRFTRPELCSVCLDVLGNLLANEHDKGCDEGFALYGVELLNGKLAALPGGVGEVVLDMGEVQLLLDEMWVGADTWGNMSEEERAADAEDGLHYKEQAEVYHALKAQVDALPPVTFTL